MTAAIVQLLNGWTLLALLTAASLWFGGYRMGRHDGWLAGRAALRREQLDELTHRINGSDTCSSSPRSLRIVHDPHGIFDFEAEA